MGTEVMPWQFADQVYVSGLAGDVTEEDLAAHFGSIGMLKDDKKRGKPKIWLYRDKATNALKVLCLQGLGPLRSLLLSPE